MHTVALSARQRPDMFLLIRSFEVKATNICARRCLVLADFKHIKSVRNFFPNGFAVIQRITALVNIGDVDGIAPVDLAAVGCFNTGQHFKERGLARAVGSDDADDTARR